LKFKLWSKTSSKDSARLLKSKTSKNLNRGLAREVNFSKKSPKSKAN
jgi:hypothetical protein